MYSYIKGTLAKAEDNILVVEACGVGYEICASSETIARIGKPGAECKVYTYLSVREDEMSLYGFADTVEKDLFIKLINVSGIGCKMAISILSSGSLSDIISSIVAADVSALSKIKGVGKKTAERLVVELRDKLSLNGASAPMSFASTAITASNGEAVEALVSLGYTVQEAKAAVARVEKPGMRTEDIVLAALKG